MADTLDFGDETWPQARGTVITTLRSLHLAVEGNGAQGLKADVRDLKAYGKATVFWGKVIAGLLTLVFLAMAGVGAILVLYRGH